MSALLKQYREMASSGQQFRGLNVLQYAKHLHKLVKHFDVRTVLDYGCGAGDQWRSPHDLHKLLGVRRADVTLYDPSFRGLDRAPSGRFDLVLCSDVLEHVPEAHVDEFIDALFARARILVWASVCCRPAKKSFPDGTNLHCTVQPKEWWVGKFVDAGARHGVTFSLEETP